MEESEDIKNVSEIEINLIGHPRISIHTICDECGRRNWSSSSPGNDNLIKDQSHLHDQRTLHSPYSVSVTSNQKHQNKPSKVLSIAEKWEKEINSNLNINRSRTRSTGEIGTSKSDVNIDICKSCQARIGYSPLFSTVSSSLKWKRNYCKNHPLWISKPIQSSEMCSARIRKFGSHVTCDIANCSKCCVKYSNKSINSNEITFENNARSQDRYHIDSNNIQPDHGENISQKLKLLNIENQGAILNLIDIVSKVDGAVIITNVVHSNCFNNTHQEMKVGKNNLPYDNTSSAQENQAFRTNTLFSKIDIGNVSLQELPQNDLMFSNYNSEHQENAIPTNMQSSGNSNEYCHDIKQCSEKCDTEYNNKRNSASTGSIYESGSESVGNSNSTEQLNEKLVISEVEIKNRPYNEEHNNSNQFYNEIPSTVTSNFDSSRSVEHDKNSSVKIRMYKTSR